MWKPSHLQDISLTHRTLSADNEVSQNLTFWKAYAFLYVMNYFILPVNCTFVVFHNIL